MSQEHGGPVIPPGTEFPCRRLLQLAGQRRRLYTVVKIIYKNLVRTSQETHYVTATKPNRLMLLRETVAVYCENHMEYTNALCGQNAEFCFVRAGGTHSNHLVLKGEC
jgi:hypothetical protein